MRRAIAAVVLAAAACGRHPPATEQPSAPSAPTWGDRLRGFALELARAVCEEDVEAPRDAGP